MPNERLYTSRRVAIAEALGEVLKKIDGTGDFNVNLEGRVHTSLVFWDEIQEFPSVSISLGSETRQYQGGGYKDRFLNIGIKCYINTEYSDAQLESLLEDIETVLEANSSLEYIDKQGNTQRIQQITINSISTDEGVLEPYGIGEILCEVWY